jgi:dipeptidyl aminopeptidase/acylaminoacyl peptidase
VILLCDGMPSVPRKQPLMEFLAARGYWVIYARWRGAWESGGSFLQRPPENDLRDILDELPSGLRETAFDRRFRLTPRHVFVIGGSFGGTAALLASLDPRVEKVVANCPVVDWAILQQEQKKETSAASYTAYLRDAWGHAYRLSDRNWNKLRSGRFFNPAAHTAEFDARKILMFHAQDDPYLPWRQVRDFAQHTGIPLRLLRSGGHLSTDRTVRRHWRAIARWFGQVH